MVEGAIRDGSHNRGRVEEDFGAMDHPRPSASFREQQLAARGANRVCTFTHGMAARRKEGVGTAVRKVICNLSFLS